MDLRIYFQKIRDVEEKLVQEFAVVVSHETGDGGKAGTLTEVVPRVAARLIVDGLARLATLEESTAFQAAQAEAKRVADQLAAAAKVQLAVLSTGELDKLKSAGKSRNRAN